MGNGEMEMVCEMGTLETRMKGFVVRDVGNALC